MKHFLCVQSFVLLFKYAQTTDGGCSVWMTWWHLGSRCGWCSVAVNVLFVAILFSIVNGFRMFAGWDGMMSAQLGKLRVTLKYYVPREGLWTRHTSWPVTVDHQWDERNSQYWQTDSNWAVYQVKFTSSYRPKQARQAGVTLGMLSSWLSRRAGLLMYGVPIRYFPKHHSCHSANRNHLD